MRSQWLIRFLTCVASLALVLSALPLSAQSRSEEDRDSNRTQQTRERDDRDTQRDTQQDRSSSQSRNRDQGYREEYQGSSRDRQQSRDRTEYRDQGEYRDQSRQQGRDTQEHWENEGGLGVVLMDTRDGIRIRQVLPGSAAERAGVRPGDYVLSVDDERARSVQDVEQCIRDKEPGEWIDLEVWRNGERQTIEAQLASRQRTFGDQGQRQGFPQQGPMTGRPQQFQEGGTQQLAQQIQSLERQLAQLRQEVAQLRSERQALRPTFEDRDNPSSRPRQTDRSNFDERSNDRRQPND
jgi:C-terminal processing protease CtpA/Prc